MNTDLIVVTGLVVMLYYAFKKPALVQNKTGQALANQLMNNSIIRMNMGIVSIDKVLANAVRFKDSESEVFEVGYDPESNEYYRVNYTASGSIKITGKRLEDVVIY